MQTNVSEVARLRERLANEYMAGKLALHGLNSGTAHHRFITVRQENIAAVHEELRGLVGEQAIEIVNETIENLPYTPTRSYVLSTLLYELGENEETKHLCNCLKEIWETIDMLTKRFGDEAVRKMIHAPAFSPVGEIPPS